MGTKHLRILSGFMVTATLDEIEPYRLEMGSRLAQRENRFTIIGVVLAEALNE